MNITMRVLILYLLKNIRTQCTLYFSEDSIDVFHAQLEALTDN